MVERLGKPCYRSSASDQNNPITCPICDTADTVSMSVGNARNGERIIWCERGHKTYYMVVDGRETLIQMDQDGFKWMPTLNGKVVK